MDVSDRRLHIIYLVYILSRKELIILVKLQYPVTSLNCWPNHPQEKGPSFFFDNSNMFQGYSLPQTPKMVSKKNINSILKDIKSQKKENSQQEVLHSLSKNRLGLNCKTNIREEKSEGVIIMQISSNSILKDSGLRIGDVIQKMEGVSIRDMQQLKSALAYPLDLSLPLSFSIMREGQLLNVNLK